MSDEKITLVIATTQSNDPEVHSADCADVRRGRKSGKYTRSWKVRVDEPEEAAYHFWEDFLPGGCAYGESEPAMTLEDAVSYTKFLPCTEPPADVDADRDDTGRLERNEELYGTAQPASCKCGCGAPATKNRLYRQGHDAKHIAKLFRAIRADKIQVADALFVLRESPVLAAKLLAQLARHSK